MSSSYQVRRDGNVGPDNYTLEQLGQMFASGSLLATDEASPAGQEQWQPLQNVIASNAAAAPPPPPPPPPAATSGLAGAFANPGGDWLMEAKLVRWIFRGGLIAGLITTFFPWFSVSVMGQGGSMLGIETDPGIFTFILAGISLGLTWAPVVKPWTFIGSGLAFILVFGTVIGVFWGSVSTASAMASMGGGSMGWGFGAWLCVLVLAGATTFGVFAFIQNQKNAPAWIKG